MHAFTEISYRVNFNGLKPVKKSEGENILNKSERVKNKLGIKKKFMKEIFKC